MYVIGNSSVMNKTKYFDILHGKNDFEMSKNLARYRSENNFVELSKLL